MYRNYDVCAYDVHLYHPTTCILFFGDRSQICSRGAYCLVFVFRFAAIRAPLNRTKTRRTLCSSATKHHHNFSLPVCFHMNSSAQLKTAVENIQDELLRIVAVADLQQLETSVASDEFKAKLINEFNIKLRGFKSKVRALTEENRKLKARIAELEKSKKPLAVRSVPNETFTAPAKRPRVSDENEEQVQILSSPLKNGPDMTSSQFNKLPTQYSSQSVPSLAERPDLKPPVLDFGTRIGSPEAARISSPEIGADAESPKPRVREDASPSDNSAPMRQSLSPDLGEYAKLPAPRVRSPASSPVSVAFADVVADSQESCEPLETVPQHYTSLQRAQFLRNYLRMKLSDPKFRVCLRQNPVTEQPWVLDDCQPNASYCKPKHAPSRARAMTKAQEQVYDAFFREAGFGAPAAGPRWDDAEESQSAPPRSQIMDKYLSPPGFMEALFPSTQEEARRKQQVREKSEARLARRLESALAGGEFVFYEEVLNTYVTQGRYTR